jgi:acetoin utilization protein AcuB
MGAKDETIGRYMTPCPHTIGADQPLERAHAMMRQYNIRHLPVLTGGRLVGLVSSRDLLFIETLREVDPATVTVDEAMSQDPYVVPSSTPLATVCAAMGEHHYGSAIVMDEGHGVLGIFTAIDALKLLAEKLGHAPAARG